MKYKTADVLPILENVKKMPNGQYVARCPAHDDKNDSFSIGDDENGNAICNCFAGCSQSDIWEAIYSKLGRPEKTPRKDSVRRSQGPIASYFYKNEKGDVIDIKNRFEPGFNGKSKSFTWSVTAKKRTEILPLYHLSDILKSELVFAVEGEKDSDNLQKLGYAATTTKDGFTSENMRYLDGKSLLIIEDNDAPGKKFARNAADLATGHARSVKVVNLAAFFPGLPQKGDITDYIEMQGKIDDLIEYARTLPEHEIDDNKAEDKKHPHAVVYDHIEHYSINKKGVLTYSNGDTVTPLCYGSMIISEEIQKNDGTETAIYFKIDAITQNGEHLRPVNVSAAEFDSLNWISKEYGSSIVVAPTQSAKQKLIAGIKLSGRHAKRANVYTHTGYITEDKKPRSYIHANGCINGETASEIVDSLSQYKMKGVSRSIDEARNAARASLSLLDAHGPEITYPLFAFVYLAPLAPIISETIGDSGFCLYLKGKTQSGKSTLAALAMSHYGSFDAMTPPITFNSTSNYIRELSFYLKDSILWIDDFHPRGTKRDADKQNAIFQDIARAAGDHAQRGRLTSAAKLQALHRPRCLFLATGEDTPQIGQSGTARLFTLSVKRSRADIKELRNNARKGVLSRAMSDYIFSIISNYESAREAFSEAYESIENKAIEQFEESRLSSQVSLLCISAYMYLKYAQTLGVIDDANKHLETFSQYIYAAAEQINREIKKQDPVTMYLTALRDIVSSGSRLVINLDIESDYQYTSYNLGPKDDYIGWFDRVYYYLEPKKTYHAICEYWDTQRMFFATYPDTIQRELCDLGYIIPDRRNNPASGKTIGGKTRRVLKIKRETIDEIGGDLYD